jgi:hypothetical protein
MGSETASTTRQRLAGRICATCGVGLPQSRTHGHGERLCPNCSPALPRPYEVLMNFQTDVHSLKGYAITFLLSDARTPVGRRYVLPSFERLQAFVMRTRPANGTLEELNRDNARWSRGTVHLFLTEQEFRDLASGKRRSGK